MRIVHAMPWRRRLAWIALLGLALTACSDSKDDDVIGATCSSNGDCRFVCATGAGFPNGFCTIPCAQDNQCPRGGVLCMKAEQEVCLFTCGSNADCGFLGARWACRNLDRVGGGMANACI